MILLYLYLKSNGRFIRVASMHIQRCIVTLKYETIGYQDYEIKQINYAYFCNESLNKVNLTLKIL